MRQFFAAYRDDPKLSPLVRVLPWTHNLIVLGQSKRPEEREFYLRMAVQEHWSKRELERQFRLAAFERAVLHLTESITRLSETHVPEEDLAAVTAVFGEERTAALVSLIIVINVWDAIGVTTRCWPVARDQA